MNQSIAQPYHYLPFVQQKSEQMDWMQDRFFERRYPAMEIKDPDYFFHFGDEIAHDPFQLNQTRDNSSGPSIPDKTNYSKQCLKFCRKLSNLILDHIKLKSELIVSSLTYTCQISKAVFTSYQYPLIEVSQLFNLYKDFLEHIWSQFRSHMSYSQNKSICIVKNESWTLVFDVKVFKTSLKEFLKSPEVINTYKYLVEKISQDEMILDALAKILHGCCIVLAITAILKDNDSKARYLRKLEMTDNFLTLLLFPDLFKNYNHRSGKFAIECCGKCKVCRSKSIPVDFLSELEKARTKKELVKSFVDFVLPQFGCFNENQMFSLFNLVMTCL